MHQGRYRLRQLRQGRSASWSTPSWRRAASRSTRACAAASRRPARSCTRSSSRCASPPTGSCWTGTAARTRGAATAARSASRRSPRSSPRSPRPSAPSGYVLDGEQAALQDTNDHFLANLQKNGSYSVVPRIPGGEITPEKLIVIGEVARDFGLYTKITGGQRIDLFGARVEQLPLIWARLVDAGFESGHAYGKALRTVKSCVGQTWCRYGVQDSRPDGDRPGAALPGPALAAQAQVGGVRLRPRVRRGPVARTSASSPPRTAGTCTSAATAARPRATRTCSPRTSPTPNWSG